MLEPIIWRSLEGCDMGVFRWITKDNIKFKFGTVRQCCKTVTYTIGELSMLIDKLAQDVSERTVRAIITAMWPLTDDCSLEFADVYVTAYPILERLENNMPVDRGEVERLIWEVKNVLAELENVKKCCSAVYEI